MRSKSGFGVAMPLLGLLEAVQRIDPAGELDGVDGAVGVARVVLSHQQHAGRTETRITLASWYAAGLGQVDDVAETSLTSFGIASRSRLAELTH